MSIAPRSGFRNIDILREFDALRERMDRVFGEFTSGERLSPALDVQELEDAVVVKASMPGFKPDDISVEVNNGVLTIRGENREERDETKGTWHLMERRIGQVRRSMTLPVAVKEDESTATLRDGVLEVRLPKTQKSPERKIKVQAT